MKSLSKNINSSVLKSTDELQDIRIIEEAFVVGDPIFVPGREQQSTSQSDIIVNPPDTNQQELVIDPTEPTPTATDAGGLY